MCRGILGLLLDENLWGVEEGNGLIMDDRATPTCDDVNSTMVFQTV